MCGKDEDNMRFFFENVNDLSPGNSPRDNRKYKRLRNLLHRLDVDYFSLVETQLNLSLLPSILPVHKLLSKNVLTKLILSSNKQEAIDGRQQGGICSGI